MLDHFNTFITFDLTCKFLIIKEKHKVLKFYSGIVVMWYETKTTQHTMKLGEIQIMTQIEKKPLNIHEWGNFIWPKRNNETSIETSCKSMN